MPSKNSTKIYVENGFYHIYNRGVDKRTIFQDANDHKVFLKYLKEYLSPLPKPKDLKTQVSFKGSTFKGVPRQPKNYSRRIDLLAYCLMPNHFHLLIQQKDKYAIKEFMKSLATRYSMYFNYRYKREGSLFQGIYKAVMVKDDPYLLHLSRYIHLNPLEISRNIVNVYSSYADYLGIRHTKWIKPNFILKYFSNNRLPYLELKNINSYKQFVESSIDSAEILGKLTLDSY